MRIHQSLVLASALGAASVAGAAEKPAPIDVPAIHHPDQETPDWWFRAGAAAANANAGALRKAHAKNVIVFLGDGMSITTITAARIYDGQQKGGSGEENRLSFENFPATALSRTYETDFQTPDSAGTMTAIMSGVKTRAGVTDIRSTSVGKSMMPESTSSVTTSASAVSNPTIPNGASANSRSFAS